MGKRDAPPPPRRCQHTNTRAVPVLDKNGNVKHVHIECNDCNQSLYTA